MALGMRSWLGAVAAGCALMAFWKLPPSAVGPAEPSAPTAEEAAYLEASGELNAAYAALQRLRWSDSLGALIAQSRSSDGPMVLAPASVDEERLETLRRGLEMSAKSAWPGGARVALGWVIQPLGHGLDPDVRTDQRGRTETYLGTEAGVDYCMRVVVSDQPRLAAETDARLAEKGRSPVEGWGACAVTAEHGIPGPDVLRWLERGAANFALIDVPLARRTGLADQPPRRRPFGRGWAALGGSLPTGLDRCVTGDEAACASIFHDPTAMGAGSPADAEAATRSPAVAVRDRLGQFGGVPSPFLLADLESDFGAEAFGRFWRSDAPVEVAFRDAFGVAPGVWMVSWVDRIYGIDTAGPRLAGSSTTWPLGLTFALFAALAMVFHRRRRVA